MPASPPGPRSGPSSGTPSGPPPQVITGLAGVLVWTSADRFGAMAQFYEEVLGLAPRSKRQGFVNFEWGDVRLTVSVHDEVQGTAADPLRIMINLGVTGIDEMHQRLVAKGMTFLREPEQEAWGKVATFRDPDGNVIQLLETAAP